MVEVGDKIAGLTVTYAGKSNSSSSGSSRTIRWSQGAPPTPEQVERSSSSGRASQKAAYEARMRAIQAAADAKAAQAREELKKRQEIEEQRKETLVEQQAKIVLQEQRQGLNEQFGTQIDKPIQAPVIVPDKPSATGTLNLPTEDKDFRERKGDTTVFVPQFGTVTDSTPSGTKQTTPIELAKELELGAGIPLDLVGKSKGLQSEVLFSRTVLDVQSNLQGRIDTGEITVDQAQIQAEAELGKRLSGLSNTLSNLPDSGDLFKTVQQQREENIIEFGKAAGSANPFTATILGAKALQENERIIVDPKTGAVPLYPEIRQESPEAALFFGAAATGLVGGAFSALKAQDLALIEAGRAKQFTFVGKEITAGGDESFVKLIGKRSISGFDEVVEANLPTFKTGVGSKGDLFSVTGGKATSTLELTLPSRLTQGFSGDAAKITLIEQAGIFGRGEVGATLLKTGDELLALGDKTVLGDFGVIKGGPQFTKIKVKPSGIDKFSFFLPEDKVIFKPGKVTLKGGFVDETLNLGSFGGRVNTVKDVSFFKGGAVTKIRFQSTGPTGVVNFGQQGIIKKVTVEGLDLLGSGLDEGVGKVISGGGQSTTQITSTVSDIAKGSATLGQTAIEKGIITPTITETVPVVGFTLPSFGSNQVIDIRPVETAPVLTFQPPKVEELTQVTTSLVTPTVTSSGRTGGKRATRQVVVPKLEVITTQLPAQKSGQATLQQTRQRQRQRQQQRGATSFIPFGGQEISFRAGAPASIPLVFPKFPSTPTLKPRRRQFTAEVRREGVFRTVAIGDLDKVLKKGVGDVRTTLAATVRLPGAKNIPVPKGFRAKRTKEGLLLIEKRSSRLSTSGEKREIQRAKRGRRKPTAKRKKKSNDLGSLIY